MSFLKLNKEDFDEDAFMQDASEEEEQVAPMVGS